MPVRLGGATSGYTELTASAAAGNNTITVPAGNGAAYQMLRNGANAGTLEFSDNIVSGTAVASTSGTAIDFTSIPSWVKRITVMFNGVSTSGTSNIEIRLGTSSGVEATSYGGTVMVSQGGAVGSANYSTGFAVDTTTTASDVRSGFCVFCLVSGTVWACSGNFGLVNIARFSTFAGTKALSSTLDRIRITTVNGTDTFDAGSINILYE